MLTQNDIRQRTPRVSVIIPTYNYARFLPETLDSAFGQTEKDIEVVVVNDGSTDDTASLLASYEDPRLKVVHQENQGLAMARNNGAAASSAPLLVFLDADDLMEPDKIKRQADALDANPDFAVCHHDIWRITEHGNIYDQVKFDWNAPVHGNALHAACISCFLYPFTAMIRRRLLDTVGGFNPDFARGEDWDFWFRVALEGHLFYFIDTPLGRYRAHSKGTYSGHGRILDQFRSVARVIREQNRRLKRQRQLTDWHVKRLTFIYTGIGMANMHMGRHKKARGAFRAALEILPNPRTSYWAGLNAVNGGLYEEAELLFQQCLSSAPPEDIPNRANALFQMGKLAIKAGREAEADHCFLKVAEIHPRHLRACIHVLRRHPEHPPSRQALAFHEANNPYGTAVAAFQEGARDFARSLFSQSLEALPEDPRPLHYLGRISHLNGDHKSALASYQAFLERASSTVDPLPDSLLETTAMMRDECASALTHSTPCQQTTQPPESI